MTNHRKLVKDGMAAAKQRGVKFGGPRAGAGRKRTRTPEQHARRKMLMEIDARMQTKQ